MSAADAAIAGSDGRERGSTAGGVLARATSWTAMIATIVLVILFIPIRRYALPGHLPFNLELYRVLVALVVAAWVVSLLVDPRVRLRRSFLDRRLALLIGVLLLSAAVNVNRVSAVGGGQFAKTIMFFSSYLLVYWLIVSTVGSRRALELLLRVLVAGGALVALSATIESRTHFNVFNHLGGRVPFLRLVELPTSQDRGDLRAYASAEVAIALGALLVMLIPLALYLATSTRRRLWWVAAAMLFVGAFSSVSRTPVLMLIAVGAVYLWLRPRQTMRLWPLLLPALLLVHLALPGVLGSLKSAFFPKEGLVAEAKANPGGRGSGRVADLGPTLAEVGTAPILGKGFGTLVVTKDTGGQYILDDQWLGTLLEVGIAGALSWLLIFLTTLRRLGRGAREDGSDTGWLFTALAASVAAFAVGMFTYDAFGFIQETFVLFIVLALGAALVNIEGRARGALAVRGEDPGRGTAPAAGPAGSRPGRHGLLA